MKYVFYIFVVFVSLSYSNVCKIANKIMYSILKNEAYSQKDVGYPYIISFNDVSDQLMIKKTKLKQYMINPRNLDCQNKEFCEKVLKALVKNNITNVDLGPYQIHYKSHYKTVPISTFFDLQKSYIFACNYVKTKIKKYGFNWYAIASYHSETPKYNAKYQISLKEHYRSLKRN